MATNATSTSSTSTCALGLDPYIEKMIGANVSQLIRRKAIPRQDREDWEQDLRAAVLESIADFDATKASWHTYANGVVMNTVNLLLRDRSIERRNVVSLESLTARNPDNGNPVEGTSDEAPDRSDAQLRVQQVVNNLTGDPRALAETLMQHGVNGSMAALGWTNWRFYKARKELTETMKLAGLMEF
jgi:DNA-directed RNA polymerase specialized sigma24 family protein